MTGLIGPNGAGKSTLISLIVGERTPTSGTVKITPEYPGCPGHAGKSRTIGYLPQRFSLVPSMTALDTAAYAAWVNGVSGANADDAGRRALARVDLADLSATKVRALSGGQRQRLGLATAIAHDPAIVVLDEPTVGLDPGQRLKLRTLLSDLATDRAVLLSTHLVEDVAYLCHRVGVLAAGRLVYSGPYSGLVDETGHQTEGPRGSSFEHAYDKLIMEHSADT